MNLVLGRSYTSIVKLDTCNANLFRNIQERNPIFSSLFGSISVISFSESMWTWNWFNKPLYETEKP